MYQNITVKCLGDSINDDDYQAPEDSDTDADSDADERQPYDCNDTRKIYTLDELPGKTAIFIIKQGVLSMELIYNFRSLTQEKIIKFVKALQSNGMKILEFEPDKHSYAKIMTSNGVTRFFLLSDGYDEPCNFSIDVPNECCIEAFGCLLKGG